MTGIFDIQRSWTLILLLLIVQVLTSPSLQCLTLRGEQHDIIDARQMLNTQQNILNCMVQSMRKGRVSQTRSILDLYDQQYQSKMIQQLQKQLNRLQLIEQELVQSQSNCAPFLKWGQNLTHIFICMKMSHRWDSPPCLNTKSQAKIHSISYFQYVNVCIVSHNKMTFNMSLNLYWAIQNKNIEVIKDGVGTYSAVLEKQQPKVWPYLDKNQRFYPIWQEIAERYNPIHKEYTNLVDQILRQKKSKTTILEPKEKKKNTEESDNVSQQNSQQKDESFQYQDGSTPPPQVEESQNEYIPEDVKQHLQAAENKQKKQYQVQTPQHQL